ncbi:MAG TPA: hypothetical protein VHF07_02200 [Nitrospiraceae bacterium]|nr:hypothetical protein [Nitrospiraceae bacterium]
MTNVAMFLLALATCLAAGVALWIALTFIERDRRLRQKKASILRAHLVAQFQTLRESVVPRGRSLDPLQKEIYEPIAFLWMQADLLEPEEVEAVNRCGSTLLALRHKPSVNQTQARLAHRLIDETCALLTRSDVLDHRPASQWSLAQRLIKELPGLPAIGPDRVARPPQPRATTEIGMLNN